MAGSSAAPTGDGFRPRRDDDAAVDNAIAARLPPRSFTRFRKEEIEQSIAQRFEQQARQFPERIAVKTRYHEFSYAQLNALANRIARALRKANPPSRAPVALVLEQSAPLIAAILGVLKAGRPYVGLDPAHPIESLRRTVAHSEADLVISNRRHVVLATELAGGHSLIDLDDIDGELPADNLDSSPSPDDPAYIYYTSGSTGVPKGVVDSHRNVLHNVMRYTNNLKISESDRLTLFQSVAFSGAVSSLFCALLNGGTSYPIDLHEESMTAIADWLIEQRLTMFHSVPSIFERLLATGRAFPSVRVIRLEGDQSSLHHVELFKRHFGPEVTLVNGLGATETGISYQYPIRRDTLLTGSVVPIGYPTTDMQGLILDESGLPLPPGNIGEIAIKSEYLATGYWRQPELTAARFQPDSAGGPARIYRTGDLGRMAPDGCLEYLGRSDRALKLHGRWIDVQATEAAVRRLQGVSDAVVAIRDTSSGTPALVAYVVPSSKPPPKSSALRRAFAQLSGDLAAPSRYVFLEELPLDANGKVKRHALPAPDSSRPDLDAEFVAARTEMERTLTEIWEDVLKLERIGVHDDFHQLGGDSLQAIEIATRFEQELQVAVPSSILLEAPTIAQLAGRLETVEAQHACLVTMYSGGARSPFFLLHDGYGDVTSYRDLARLLDEDRPVIGVRARGLNGKEAPCERIEEMAAAYVDEIRRVRPSGPYHLGGNCLGGVLAFEVARQLRVAGETIGVLALMDTAFPTSWLRARIEWHWHRLTHRSLVGQWNHLLALAGRLARRSSKRFARTASSLVRPSDSKPLPSAKLVMAANHRALWRYRAKDYDQTTVVICVGEPHNHRGWRKVVRGELRFIRLPATGNLQDDDHIVHPPHVENLAKALRELLRDAG